MKTDFVPAISRTQMLEPGTRVMVFQEEGVWVVFGVDTYACTSGNTLQELADNWKICALIYQQVATDTPNIWEPPMPFEFEPVWESGEPCDFLEGLYARIVSLEAFTTAHREYGKRADSYNLFGTNEQN